MRKGKAEEMTLGEQIFIPRPGQPEATRKEFVDPSPVKAGFGKPSGGLWTSTYDTSAELGWEWWCLTEMPHWLTDTGYLLTPCADANILTIHGEDDARLFGEKYGDEDKKEFCISIDWGAVASDCDGLRITNPYSPGVRFGPVMAFYGWDCESTWWTRWVFETDEGRPVPVEIPDPVLTKGE